MTAEGPLTKTLEYAGDMLAATRRWAELAGEDAREKIYIAELPRGWQSDIHTPDDLRAAAPYAIVFLDDESVGSSWQFVATANTFFARHSIVMRLFLVPPEDVDVDDRNTVDAWFLNQIGTIIRGEDPVTSPGLLDLSHQGGNLIISGLNFAGPFGPSDAEQAEDQALILWCELLLTVGVDA